MCDKGNGGSSNLFVLLYSWFLCSFSPNENLSQFCYPPNLFALLRTFETQNPPPGRTARETEEWGEKRLKVERGRETEAL